MIIKNRVNIHGEYYDIEYHDADEFDGLPTDQIKQAYGVCFCDDKLVITHNVKGHWSLVGGSVEQDEPFEQTLVREIQEESNMNVLASMPIGYQITQSKKNKNQIYQLRYVCKVEPYSEFEKDPDGQIDKIKLIDITDVKNYFDWGEIGERIIERAIELKKLL